MDKDDKLRLAEIHAMVKTLSVDLQFLRRHRNVLFGTPVLEFNEVCSVLHLSARQVQRLRASVNHRMVQSVRPAAKIFTDFTSIDFEIAK